MSDEGMTMNSYFDEMMVIEQMREAQRKADRAQVLGLRHEGRPMVWRRLRAHLGRTLVALGKRLQQAEAIRGPVPVSESQCGVR